MRLISNALRQVCGTLLLLGSGCSGTGFDGSPRDGKSEAAVGRDENGAVSDEEGQLADEPTQVAGAFLTVDCGLAKTAKLPASDKTETFGCAVIDRDNLAKFTSSPVDIDHLRLVGKDGQVEKPALVAAEAESPWHVYGAVRKGFFASLKGLRANVTVKGVKAAVTNPKALLYSEVRANAAGQATLDIGSSSLEAGLGTELGLRDPQATDVPAEAGKAFDGDFSTSWKSNVAITSGYKPVNISVLTQAPARLDVIAMLLDWSGNPEGVKIKFAVDTIANGQTVKHDFDPLVAKDRHWYYLKLNGQSLSKVTAFTVFVLDSGGGKVAWREIKAFKKD